MLLDVHLVDADGLTILEEARASRPDLPASERAGVLDSFVHTGDDRLWRDTRTASSWPWDAADQGTGGEVETNMGDSVVSIGTQFGYSRVGWIGSLGGANYLYSRQGGVDPAWESL
jgi:hypothetical protein